MLDWFKHLFGWAGTELTLLERQANANSLAAHAVSSFDRIASDLEEAAADLQAVAIDAQAEVDKFLAQRREAEAAATKSLAAAGKIRGLLD